MRSSEAPRVRHDATVRMQTGELGAAFEGRSVNLSVGGLYVESERVLDPGAQVEMKVNLRDGGTPLETRGEVVWVRPQDDDGRAGMAVRFLGLDEMSARRIARLVATRAKDPTGVLKRKVRIKLDGLPAPLRAVARDLSEQGVMLEAELPWLKLGSAVTTEVAPGRARVGRLKWVGVDVAPSGVARLRISVDFAQRSESASADDANEPSAPATPIHTHENTEQLRVARRRAWPWAVLLFVLCTAAGGALWLDHAMSVRQAEGAELRVTDTLPKGSSPAPVGRIIPKTKSETSQTPAHKRARH